MTLADQLKDYSALLEIRRKYYRRNMMIGGMIYFGILIAFILSGLLRPAVGSWIYLEVALVIGLGISCVIAWVRLEVVSGTLDLLTNLDRIVRQDGEKIAV